MEKKNLIQYVLMVLIAFILVIGLFNLFKTSSNLKDAIKGINEAKAMVDESRIILKNQELAIDSIKQTNNNLLNAMKGMESQNKFIRESIAWKFNQNNKDLDAIKTSLTVVEDILKPQ